MADPATTEATQADADATPQEGTPDAQVATEAAKAAETISAEDARKLRSEAQSLRKRLRELEAERQRAADEKLSEQEKAIKAAREEAQSEERTKWTTLVRSAKLDAALRTAGVVPDLVDVALAAPELADVTVDDDGTVADIEKAIAALKDKRPSLFTKPSTVTPSFDTGLGGGRQAGKATYTRAQLRDQAFFAQHQADIEAAIREGRIVG